MESSTGKPQRSECPQCGSRAWQSIEVAYAQSCRVSESGYQTISKFGESIKPPEMRSTICSPLYTAFVLSIGALFAAPFALHWMRVSIADIWVLDPKVYAPAAVVAVLGYCVHRARNRRYNEKVWASAYLDWSEQRVCRSCGHRFPVKNLSGEVEG